jgi:ADP-heptose:LPS heptosyltransferase
MSRSRFPILFVTSSRIGDAVLTSGLIQRLVEEIPDASFTIVAGPLATPLFRDTPGLERLIPLEKEKRGMHWFKLWRQLRGRRWGLVVDFRGPLLGRLLATKRRAIRKPNEIGAPPVHKVIEAARLLRLEADPPAPFLFTSPDTEAAAEALVGGPAPILAIAPAANWVGKTWPAERFAVAAAELMAPNGPLSHARLLLLGGPEDRWAAEAVRRVISRDRLIDLVGKVDLLTAYACLKRARLFIGNDSGLMHLAAAAGTPTLGLFGPSDDRLYGPWGKNARALRGPREFEAFKAIDPNLNQAVCHMLDLPAAWVVNAAKKLLADTEAKPAAQISAPAPAKPALPPLIVSPLQPAEPVKSPAKTVAFVRPAAEPAPQLDLGPTPETPKPAEPAQPQPQPAPPAEVPDAPPAPAEVPATEPAPASAPPSPGAETLAAPEPAPKPARKPRAPRAAATETLNGEASKPKTRAPRKKKPAPEVVPLPEPASEAADD